MCCDINNFRSYDYTKGKLDEMTQIIIDSGAKLFVSAVGKHPQIPSLESKDLMDVRCTTKACGREATQAWCTIHEHDWSS